MQHYEVTAAGANGSVSTMTTPYSGSTPSWAERLRDRYGIASPMMPDDGYDEVFDPEHVMVRDSIAWRYG